MKNKIKFLVGSIQGYKDPVSFDIVSAFIPIIKIDDTLFYSKLRFDTEEEIDAKIESLKSFLKPKPKSKPEKGSTENGQE
jgi:hypothetical protein